jgi:hypothetical protein
VKTPLLVLVVALGAMILLALLFAASRLVRRVATGFPAVPAPAPIRASDEFADAPLRAKLANHRRTAWLPRTGDGEGTAEGSRFGGPPWLAAAEKWPACGNCGEPMQLFLQLDARDLPPEAVPVLEGGLLQLFYCTNSADACEVKCEAWGPGAKSTLVRLVPAGDRAAGAAAPPHTGMFPAKRIIGWDAVADYPGEEELSELGVSLSDTESDALSQSELPVQGEKLLGWPYWVQGVEYPKCPECGARMALLFQVDSESALPYMFGDSGVAHVTQCPAHRWRLAFGWACH